MRKKNKKLPSEWEIIRNCSRLSLTDKSKEKVRVLLKENINYSNLLNLAIKHRIVSLLYHHFNNSFRDLVPNNFLSVLHSHVMVSLHHNLVVKSELKSLLQIFSDNGIVGIPYKGIVLAQIAYGSLALRQGGDIDIVIINDSPLMVRDILLKKGYHSFQTVKQLKTARTSHFHYIMQTPKTRISIELHWQFTWGNLGQSIHPSLFIDRVTNVFMEGTKFPSFALEDYFLLISLHGFNHGWLVLYMLSDLDAILQQLAPVDFTNLIIKANKYKCRRIALLSIALLQEVFDYSLPQEISAILNLEPDIQKIDLRLHKNLLQKQGTIWNYFMHEYIHFIFREDFTDKVTILQRMVARTINRFITVPDYESEKSWVKIPDSLSFLYHFLRPIRLISEFILALWKQLTKNNVMSIKDVFQIMQITFFLTIIPILIRFLSMPKLLKLITPKSKSNRFSIEEQERFIYLTKKLLSINRLIFRQKCLLQSLILYYFFNKHSNNIQICFGVSKLNEKIEGHSWIMQNGKIIAEVDNPFKKYKPVYIFPE